MAMAKLKVSYVSSNSPTLSNAVRMKLAKHSCGGAAKVPTLRKVDNT